jgi:hypothetical protein
MTACATGAMRIDLRPSAHNSRADHGDADLIEGSRSRMQASDPHSVPLDWLLQAGVTDLRPLRRSFRCEVDHTLVALDDIERPMRRPDIVLDANGFGRDRMMRILLGIRADDALPPIEIERADPGQRPFRLRAGFHRYYASIALGFPLIPVEIVPRL